MAENKEELKNLLMKVKKESEKVGLKLSTFRKKTLAPWKKSYDQHRQNIKKQRLTLPTKVHIVKAIVFPVVMYGCESWTIKKAEC